MPSKFVSLDARLLCALLVLALATAWAGPSSSQRTIERLIASLAHSDCRFNRNGTWYDGAKAAAHLQRKYDYVVARQPQTTPEQFIELAGSRSSFSGKPYLVQCPGSAPLQSATWLRQQLMQLRTASEVSAHPRRASVDTGTP